MRFPNPGLAAFTFLVVAISTACGSDAAGPSPSPYPDVAGTYTGTVSATFTNSIESGQAAQGITVTLGRTSSDGRFSGSFVIANGGGSGTLAGTIRQDGGISIDQFGDPAVGAGQSMAFLQIVFNWCNFAAAASTGLSGSILGGALSISGTIVFPCNYTDGFNSWEEPSSLTYSISARR